MAWHAHAWGGAPWIGLIWLAVWILVIVGVIYLVRRRSTNGTNVLAERYARGEIDDTEYRQRLAVLRDTRRGR